MEEDNTLFNKDTNNNPIFYDIPVVNKTMHKNNNKVVIILLIILVLLFSGILFFLIRIYLNENQNEEVVEPPTKEELAKLELQKFEEALVDLGYKKVNDWFYEYKYEYLPGNSPAYEQYGFHMYTFEFSVAICLQPTFLTCSNNYYNLLSNTAEGSWIRQMAEYPDYKEVLNYTYDFNSNSYFCTVQNYVGKSPCTNYTELTDLKNEFDRILRKYDIDKDLLLDNL